MRLVTTYHSMCLFLSLLLSCHTKNDLMPTSTTEEFNKITANLKFNEITNLANPENKPNGLMIESLISSDVNLEGKSLKWIYCFTSGGIAVKYYYSATYKSVTYDSVSKVHKFPPTQLISHEWINSSIALSVAENNGGKLFRANNAGYIIEAKLEESLGYNNPTYWYITYYSIVESSIKLSFIIDATTGEIKS